MRVVVGRSYPVGIHSPADELGLRRKRRGRGQGLGTSGRHPESSLTRGEGHSSHSDDPSQSAAQTSAGISMMVLTLSGLFTGTEVQAHDEKFFQSLSVDMVGVPTFAGLFVGILTSSPLVVRIYHPTLRRKWCIITSNTSLYPPRSLNNSPLSPHKFPSHLLPHRLSPHSTHRYRTSK